MSWIRYIKRNVIEEINRYTGTNDVIVLHGARQVGKTSILYYLKDQLKKDGQTTYFIDLEDSRFVTILNAGVMDIDKFNKLLEALASQSGQQLNVAELSNTTIISKQTIEKYLFIMENTYILKLVRPFSRNVRSELFKLPKIYFYDTGLMQMLWQLKNYKVVSLNGSPKNEFCVYPWDV